MSAELHIPGTEQLLEVMGFECHPFPVVPDSRNYFATPSLRDVAHEILFAIVQRKGFVVVSGDVGVGKTTLSRYLLSRLDEREYTFALILNSYLQEEELIDAILRDFGLESAAEEDLQSRIARLNRFFVEQREQGRNCVLIIDDAQNLSVRSLEAVRLLSNLETESEKLVQILLIGQDELKTTLNLDVLRQLRSRVVLWRTLQPFSRHDLDAYIQARLDGNQKRRDYRITRSALNRVYTYSRGNLRRANMLLDRALLALLSVDSETIDARLIGECVKDIEGTGLNRWKRKLYGIGSAVLLLSIALLVAYFSGSKTGRDALDTVQDVRTEQSNEQQWQHYLSGYGLQDFADATWIRLQRHDLAGVKALLNEVSPLRLSLVPVAMLSGEGKKMGIVFPDASGGQAQRLILWRPDINVESFRVGVESSAVHQLQQYLYEQGYYSAAVDGKVGVHTVQAIMLYQAQMGIPVTGLIDEKTLLAINVPGLFAG